MKLNYNPYNKKKKEETEQVDYQLFKNFQDGLQEDLESQKSNIKLATQSAAQMMANGQGGTAS